MIESDSDYINDIAGGKKETTDEEKKPVIDEEVDVTQSTKEVQETDVNASKDNSKEKVEEEAANEEIANKGTENKEVVKKRAEDEEIVKKSNEDVEIVKKKAEEEEEEIAKRKAEAVEIAKKKAEEEDIVKKKVEEEEIAKKKAEAEEIAKKKAEEDTIAKKKKAEEEEIAKKIAEAEEIAKKKAEEDVIAKKKAEEEEIAKKKAEAEEIAKKKAEEDVIAKKKAEEDAIAKKKGDMDAKAVKEVDGEKRSAASKSDGTDKCKKESGQLSPLLTSSFDENKSKVRKPPEPPHPPPKLPLEASIEDENMNNTSKITMEIDEETEGIESLNNKERHNLSTGLQPPRPPKEKIIARIESTLDAVDDHAPISLSTVPPRTILNVAESLENSKYPKSRLIHGLFRRPKNADKSQTSIVDDMLEDESLYTYFSGNLTQDELMLRQLQGIFAIHDDDKDGKINKSQLSACLRLLGLGTREKLLLKYLNPTGSSLQKPSAKKSNLTAFAISKVDLKTFLYVTVKELQSSQSKMKEDLLFVFEFLDPNQTGFVSVKDLRHILTETMSDSNLDGNMFLNVLDAGGITVDSIRQEKSLTINYHALIDNLLMGNRWQSMLF